MESKEAGRLKNWEDKVLLAGKKNMPWVLFASTLLPHLSCQITVVQFSCRTKQVSCLRYQAVLHNCSS